MLRFRVLSASFSSWVLTSFSTWVLIAEDIGDILNNSTNDIITNHDSVNKIKERHRANTFEFCKIEYDEVLSTLKKRNPNKATGFDLIPTRAVKVAADEITIPLTKIYNQVLEKNEWPRDWKRGEWTPVYKKDDPLDKVKYRPVPVLTSVDKVFEQMLCRQLKEMSESVLDTSLPTVQK